MMEIAIPPAPLAPARLTGEPDSRLVNLPNAISATRLPLAFVFWACIDQPVLAVAILLLAGLTDMLDGLVARRTHSSNRIGAVVDPIFDKLFVVIAVIALVWTERLGLGQLALLITRDLLMLPLVALLPLLSPRTRSMLTLRSNYFGKVTTVTQFFTLVAALAFPQWLEPLLLLSAGLGVACVASYFVRALIESRRAARVDTSIGAR